jgi:hypothetical protein
VPGVRLQGPGISPRRSRVPAGVHRGHEEVCHEDAKNKMSLQAHSLEPIPELTSRIARASSPKGTLPMQLRDALRAGIEGTISEGVRNHGLRRARSRGQPKTQLQAQAIAVAINLVRIRQLLQRTQLGLSSRPKRPLSPFAQLRSRLAA